MKKILLSLFVLMSLGTQAQKLEHNLYAGFGMFFQSGKELNNGATFKVGYGLNCYFSEQWSVMPGVAYREANENMFKSAKDGASDDHFKFIDVPVVAQYHIGNGKGSWTLGLGPVFSFCVESSKYHFDADPNSPFNGVRKCANLLASACSPAFPISLRTNGELVSRGISA